jgi:hypothetical protein
MLERRICGRQTHRPEYDGEGAHGEAHKIEQRGAFAFLNMVAKTGLSALIYYGAQLSVECDLEVIAMGSPQGASPDSCMLGLAGDNLFFTITLAGERITVAAQTMDGSEDPDPLLKIEDSAMGWDVVFRLVRSMVENEVRSLQRPICSGMIGLPDSWIIG